jgi:hypothetical protein
MDESYKITKKRIFLKKINEIPIGSILLILLSFISLIAGITTLVIILKEDFLAEDSLKTYEIRNYEGIYFPLNTSLNKLENLIETINNSISKSECERYIEDARGFLKDRDYVESFFELEKADYCFCKSVTKNITKDEFEKKRSIIALLKKKLINLEACKSAYSTIQGYEWGYFCRIHHYRATVYLEYLEKLTSDYNISEVQDEIALTTTLIESTTLSAILTNISETEGNPNSGSACIQKVLEGINHTNYSFFEVTPFEDNLVHLISDETDLTYEKFNHTDIPCNPYYELLDRRYKAIKASNQNFNMNISEIEGRTIQNNQLLQKFIKDNNWEKTNFLFPIWLFYEASHPPRYLTEGQKKIYSYILSNSSIDFFYKWNDTVNREYTRVSIWKNPRTEVNIDFESLSSGKISDILHWVCQVDHCEDNGAIFTEGSYLDILDTRFYINDVEKSLIETDNGNFRIFPFVYQKGEINKEYVLTFEKKPEPRLLFIGIESPSSLVSMFPFNFYEYKFYPTNRLAKKTFIKVRVPEGIFMDYYSGEYTYGKKTQNFKPNPEESLNLYILEDNTGFIKFREKEIIIRLKDGSMFDRLNFIILWFLGVLAGLMAKREIRYGNHPINVLVTSTMVPYFLVILSLKDLHMITLIHFSYLLGIPLGWLVYSLGGIQIDICLNRFFKKEKKKKLKHIYIDHNN